MKPSTTRTRADGVGRARRWVTDAALLHPVRLVPTPTIPQENCACSGEDLVLFRDPARPGVGLLHARVLPSRHPLYYGRSRRRQSLLAITLEVDTEAALAWRSFRHMRPATGPCRHLG